jgi:hypothetical protein
VQGKLDPHTTVCGLLLFKSLTFSRFACLLFQAHAPCDEEEKVELFNPYTSGQFYDVADTDEVPETNNNRMMRSDHSARKIYLQLD